MGLGYSTHADVFGQAGWERHSAIVRCSQGCGLRRGRNAMEWREGGGGEG